MRTILFGGSGFLGPIILEKYPDIISVGRSTPPAEVKNKHIHFDSIDDLRVLDDIEVENVIFLIGNSNHYQINNHSTMGFDYNVIPLKKALYYFKNRNLKKFIAFTTIFLYDVNKMKLPVDESQPLNPYINEYVFSKYIAEEITKLYQNSIPTINIRLNNIYGPTRLIRPDLVPTLIQSVLSSTEPTASIVNAERDFIYVKDAADAVIALLGTDYTGPINLGAGEMNSVSKIVEIIENLSGKKFTIKEQSASGPMKFQTDISLLKKLTGWNPKYSLEEGLTETYNIMKSLTQKR